jgi:hypothetical protein
MATPTAPTRRRPRARSRAQAPPEWRPFPGPVYRPRRPTQTALYQVVQRHLETFLAQASSADPMGYGLPEWVERDFRCYLECGILAHGFARARCEDCGHHRLGAERSGVLGLVLGQGAKLAAFGVALGLLGTFYSGRLLERYLFGVSSRDAATLGAVCVMVAAVTLLSAYLPARRAATIDPLEALRAE